MPGSDLKIHAEYSSLDHPLCKEEILVFKTNASAYNDLERLSRLLRNKPGIKSWNFDFDDCDKVFRLVSIGITSEEIIELLSSVNILASELI